jgi:formylglycine-generating enzyme required for sulfatase activity
MFSVPANTPLSVQPLDDENKAIQLMRSWFTAMPGETVSCVGCHEKSNHIPTLHKRIASTRPTAKIDLWYGPSRGLDFERDVQPVLDQYCAGCHNGTDQAMPDLRAERYAKNYQGRQLTRLAANRLHPVVRTALGGTKVKYTPAYEALIPYIRRVNIEDHVGLLVPGEYHADTSELIQMLSKGHHNVQLDKEAWDRLVTWIDLNGPCHGTWGDVGPIPEGADKRRRQLSQLYGGPKADPETIPDLPRKHIEPILPEQISETEQHIPKLDDWVFDYEPDSKTIDLGAGVTIKLVRIPAGKFFMGDASGEPDERPPTLVTISSDFWMGAFEVTNSQYHRFDPEHDSGYFTKRFQGPDGPGLSLAEPEQPVVRVSWERAMEFCRWLSSQTGMNFTLPTEAQWEYACSAGSQNSLSYGGVDTDFSQWANVADKSLTVPPRPTGGLESNITAHFGKGILESAVYGSNILCDIRFDDRAIATSKVGSYKPNHLGLYDMHGNACEWTLTTYEPYPYKADDGRNNPTEQGRKVVRGGSWCDRPKRCRSAFRLSYPEWQRVYNVGFRVISEIEASEQKYVFSTSFNEYNTKQRDLELQSYGDN